MDKDEKDRVRERAELEQSLAQFRDTIPRMWRNIYDGCLDEGFTEEQAMELLIAFIQKPPTE